MATDGDLWGRALIRGLDARRGALLIVRPDGMSLVIGGRRAWTGDAAGGGAFPASGLYEAKATRTSFQLRGVDDPDRCAVLHAPPGLPELAGVSLLAIVEQSDPAAHVDEER